MGKRKEDTVVAERVTTDEGRCGTDERRVAYAADLLFGAWVSRRGKGEGGRGWTRFEFGVPT